MSRAPSRRQILTSQSRTVQFNDRFGLYPNGKPCFLCGRTLRGAADEQSIFARVATGIVFLHGRCAVELGERLVRAGEALPVNRDAEG
jgi:hypothetical protein